MNNNIEEEILIEQALAAPTVCEENDKQCQFTQDKSYALAMANSFLNYFFDELENGIDTVMQKSTLM